MKPGCVLPIILLALHFTSFPAEGENILFFLQMSTYSHLIVMWPLIEQLADHGHNVTIHQPNHDLKSLRTNHHPRIHHLVSKNIHVNSTYPNFIQHRLDYGTWCNLATRNRYVELALTRCDNFLSDPAVQDFLSSAHFDLVVIDSRHNDCGFGLAHFFRAQIVIFCTGHGISGIHEPLGVIFDTSVVAERNLPFQYPMTFGQRVITTLLVTWMDLSRAYLLLPRFDDLLREKLKLPNMPSISEIQKQNTSLVLYNGHYSGDIPRTLPPMFVAVGGIHIGHGNGKQQLSKTILDFIESSTNGFIYVGFGSAAKISEAPQWIRNIFMNAFASSKINFLWKWEGKRPLEMSDNVLTVDWLPQQEVLASNSCRGFVSHGGLLSVQESTYFGVPMIAIPIFSDQIYNALQLERTGRGINLDLGRLTEKQLRDSINEILTNETYKHNAAEARVLFRDRPMSPLDTALFWVEYVLRHNDSTPLRPLSVHGNWFQRRLLDVWAFILGVISCCLYIVYLLGKRVVYRLEKKTKLKTN